MLNFILGPRPTEKSLIVHHSLLFLTTIIEVDLQHISYIMVFYKNSGLLFRSEIMDGQVLRLLKKKKLVHFSNTCI